MDEDAERRWFSITLLASLDVVVPMHFTMGWASITGQKLLDAARDALRERKTQVTRPAYDSLAERVDENTAAALRQWERDAFVDLPRDDLHASAWLDYLTAGVDQGYLERKPKTQALLGTLIDHYAKGPVTGLIAHAQMQPLSRIDALIYARYELDHDDPGSDDPLTWVKYHSDVAAFRRCAMEWRSEMSAPMQKWLHRQAARWHQVRGTWLPEPLLPLDEISSERRGYVDSPV